ncbi:MAG: hypothetical protein K2O84_07480 [Oscillospiraceae bacterium]|nr:hypothetical protein [Oscillospiraceae bacterium]
MKNVKTPKRRIFFRCTALKNLEIHKVFLRFFALSIEKISHFWSFRHLSNKPYMQALREKFFSDDIYAEQRQEIETIRCKLSHTLNKQRRKQLLQLVDAESQLRDDIALASFIAGFRLACGIGSELGRSNWYSYVENEEQRLSEAFDERRDP